MIYRMSRRAITARSVPHAGVTLILVVVLAVVTAGCGGPEFTSEEAAELIRAQWPDSELEMRNAYVDEQGRGVAAARFDGEPWEFYFEPTDEGGWNLEAVSVDGSFYYLRDLEQTSATILLMSETAGALGRYKVANDTYPVGESADALAVLSPDYIAEETQKSDAWQQDFLYESDGTDYTLTSIGADGQSGTRDDIVLYNGEFIGSSGQGQGGQGQ